MADEPTPTSPGELKHRIGALRRQKEPENSGRKEESAASAAIHYASDLVAGLIVGGGGGFLLDRELGTSPWFLLGGIFLGMGSGFMMIYRDVTRSIERAEGDTKPAQKNMEKKPK